VVCTGLATSSSSGRSDDLRRDRLPMPRAGELPVTVAEPPDDDDTICLYRSKNGSLALVWVLSAVRAVVNAAMWSPLESERSVLNEEEDPLRGGAVERLDIAGVERCPGGEGTIDGSGPIAEADR